MQDLNRTFVGIRLPADVQVKLSDVQQSLRRRAGPEVLRFIPPHELHLVILALGELSALTLKQVHEAISPSTCRHAPFELAVAGIGGSPSALQPRYAWAGVKGDIEALTSLHNTLEAQLLPVLPDYKPKPFLPHIDLGRMKVESEQNRAALGRAIKMTPVETIATLSINTFETFRSVSSMSGPCLEPITIYKLGGQDN